MRSDSQVNRILPSAILKSDRMVRGHRQMVRQLRHTGQGCEGAESNGVGYTCRAEGACDQVPSADILNRLDNGLIPDMDCNRRACNEATATGVIQSL